MVKAVVWCDRAKAAIVHLRKRLPHFITLSARTSTLPGAAFRFAFTLKNKMCVRQGLSQTSPQLTPLPSSFVELSSWAPSISSHLAAPVAESASCFGQYWGTWPHLGTGRWESASSHLQIGSLWVFPLTPLFGSQRSKMHISKLVLVKKIKKAYSPVSPTFRP